MFCLHYALLLVCALGFVLAAPFEDLLLSRRAISGKTRTGNKLGCFDVIGEDGEYFYESDGITNECVIFLMAEPDEVITVDHLHVDREVRCDPEGNQWVMFIDGWVFKGEMYPREEGRHLYERVFNTDCFQTILTRRSSQNIAELNFKITTPGKGFRFQFKKDKAGRVCDAVITLQQSGRYTIKNYGRKVNCSLSIMAPVNILVTDMRVGYSHSKNTVECDRHTDYVELLDRVSFEKNKLKTVSTICGKSDMQVMSEGNLEMAWHNVCVPRKPGSNTITHHASYNSRRSPAGQLYSERLSTDYICTEREYLNVALSCLNVVIRLVSSGNYDNEISFEFSDIESSCH